MIPIHVDMAARDGSLHLGQLVSYRAWHWLVKEIVQLKGGKVRVYLCRADCPKAARIQDTILVLKTR